MKNSNTNFININNNQINNQEILELAQLSCMELTAEEQTSLASSLSQTLEHFSIISGVADGNQAASLPVQRSASLAELRHDEAISWSEEDLHTAAPDYEETYYFVPKVL